MGIPNASLDVTLVYLERLHLKALIFYTITSQKGPVEVGCMLLCYY